MSAKGGIHRDHGPFVAKINRDIAEAKAAKYASVLQKEIDKGVSVEKAEQIAAVNADKLFISWEPQREFMSIGKAYKHKMENENNAAKLRITDYNTLIANHTKGPLPNKDYIDKLKLIISTDTQIIKDNELLLSQLDTELAEMLKGGSKKQSKKYRKSNKRTYRRRRVRKTKTQRTRI